MRRVQSVLRYSNIPTENEEGRKADTDGGKRGKWIRQMRHLFNQ